MIKFELYKIHSEIFLFLLSREILHFRVGYHTREKHLFTIQYLYIELYDCELYGCCG